jgi:hypothetical protein
MNHLTNIAQSAEPGPGIQFRLQAYGANAIDSFLRDVLSLANASISGPRYIVVGAGFDGSGQRRITGIDTSDFSGKPSYEALAHEFIEPPLRIHYHPVSAAGKRVGVFEIGDCQDRPYMMRIDYSETLRRGDAYKQSGELSIKMGRQQLMQLFEKKFHDSVSTKDIEVGFAGDIIHKSMTLKHADLSTLPSRIAAAKIEQIVKIRSKSQNTGSTSIMARLMHARLYGSDDPYVSRTVEELMEDIENTPIKFRHQDGNYLFEKNRKEIQLVVYNQGKEPILDASLELVMPKDRDFFLADELPRILRDGELVRRPVDDTKIYPAVRQNANSIHVTHKIGEVPVGEPVRAFSAPLRVCAGPALVGRRFGIRYALHGQNLRAPAKGTLRLNFT